MAGGRFPWSNPSQPSAQGPFPETAVDSPGMAELCLVRTGRGDGRTPGTTVSSRPGMAPQSVRAGGAHGCLGCTLPHSHWPQEK